MKHWRQPPAAAAADIEVVGVLILELCRTVEPRIQAAEDTRPATVVRIRRIVRAEPAQWSVDTLAAADTEIQGLDVIEEVDMLLEQK